MSSSKINLAEFELKRSDLLSILVDSRNLLEQAELNEWCSTLDELNERLACETFKLLIIGEFKRGKSTFINALIGQEVLPAFPTPCTAIINELKWGDTPSATLHFKSPVPQPLPKTLDEEARLHIGRHGGENVPAMQIDAKDLERFVVIPQTSSQEKHDFETPYDFAEIYWPLELLCNSVEIIDSPGLNEHGSRSKITMDYLGKIDAVLFVLSVSALASETELAVVDNNIIGGGHSEIFFICNRFDELRRKSDRERVISHAHEALASRTSFGKQGVFFTSAIDAVIGREENDERAVERSGILELEASLSKFLVEERGKIKLLRPARQLNGAIQSALQDSIPSQRKMLESDIADFQKRYDQAQPQLKKATKNREHVVRRLEKAADRMWSAVNDAASLHIRSIVEEIPFWAEQVDLESKINVLKMWALQAQIEAITDEVVKGITVLAEQSTASWQEMRLKPLLEDHLEDFAETAETHIEGFMNEIGQIREQLTGINRDSIAGESVSPTERVLSGVGGLVLGGVGSAIEGAVGGYDGMLRSLLPQIALAVGAVWVLHLNPITIVPALIGLGLFRSFRQGDAITGKVRRQIGEEMARMLASNSSQLSQEIADQAREKCLGEIERIQTSLDREIITIKQEVEAIYKAKKAGEAAIRAKLEQISSVESGLAIAEEKIQAFIANLVRN